MATGLKRYMSVLLSVAALLTLTCRINAQQRPDPQVATIQEIDNYWRIKDFNLRKEYDDKYYRSHLDGNHDQAKSYYADYIKLSQALNKKWQEDRTIRQQLDANKVSKDREEAKHSYQVNEALQIITRRFPNDPDILKELYWKVAKASDPISFATTYQRPVARPNPNVQETSLPPKSDGQTVASTNTPLNSSKSSDPSQKMAPTQIKRAAELAFFKTDPAAIKIHESKMDSAVETLKSRFKDIDAIKLEKWKKYFAKIDNPLKVSSYISPDDGYPDIRMPTQSEIDAYESGQRECSQAYVRIGTNCQQYKSIAKMEEKPTVDQALIEKNSDGLEKKYYEHRSVSPLSALSFAERCLKIVILEKYPLYALSDDYIVATSKMDEQRIKLEATLEPIVCSSQNNSRAFISTVADKLIHDLSNEWRMSAERRTAERDIATSKRDAELEARFRPTAETEAGALPLTCKIDAQTPNDQTIGRIFSVPSGAEIANNAASAVSKLDMFRKDESYLSSMLRRSGEISGAKSAASDEIARARADFFRATPNTQARKSASDTFGDLLAAKDLFYLSQYVPEGTGLKAQERQDAVRTFTGGNGIDGGIGEAWGEFSQWVEAVRRAMHAPPPGSFWLPTPNQYSEALQSTMPVYIEYKRARDAAEFNRWSREYGPKPTPPASIQEKISKYFEYIFDPAIMAKFCSAESNQQQSMIHDRQVVRAAFYTWEMMPITPELVMERYLTDENFNTKDNPSNLEYLKRVKSNFLASVDSQKTSGATDPKTISLKAMQVALADGHHQDSFITPLPIVESHIKEKFQKTLGIEEQFDRVRSKYDLRAPTYAFEADILATGDYRRLRRPR